MNFAIDQQFSRGKVSQGTLRLQPIEANNHFLDMVCYKAVHNYLSPFEYCFDSYCSKNRDTGSVHCVQSDRTFNELLSYGK